jgi:preprotein translocase subunit SecA
MESLVQSLTGEKADMRKWLADTPDLSEQTVFERVKRIADIKMESQRAKYGAEFMNRIEKSVMLQVLDQIWKENLLQLDYLKKGIGLRAYAHIDPLNAYKKEAFMIFENNMMRVKEGVTRTLLTTEFTPESVERMTEDDDEGYDDSDAEGARFIDMSIPRNAPCPCGSGLKYKHCHGRLAS